MSHADRSGSRPPRRHPAQIVFFPAAALHAALVGPLSVHGMTIGPPLLPGLAAATHHAHELLFGFALAVVTGFLANRARPTTIGLLFGLWLAGRVAFLLAPMTFISALANAGFAVALAGVAVPPFMKAAKQRGATRRIGADPARHRRLSARLPPRRWPRARTPPAHGAAPGGARGARPADAVHGRVVSSPRRPRATSGTRAITPSLASSRASRGAAPAGRRQRRRARVDSGGGPLAGLLLIAASGRHARTPGPVAPAALPHTRRSRADRRRPGVAGRRPGAAARGRPAHGAGQLATHGRPRRDRRCPGHASPSR
ncbi:MAG: NnrS family protein [Halofilum sp. (in: g-proteobacteria)]|nr:NnrS family protein [Halofilum sp. (in: g-proteobacteria)]